MPTLINKCNSHNTWPLSSHLCDLNTVFAVSARDDLDSQAAAMPTRSVIVCYRKSFTTAGHHRRHLWWGEWAASHPLMFGLIVHSERENSRLVYRQISSMIQRLDLWHRNSHDRFGYATLMLLVWLDISEGTCRLVCGSNIQRFSSTRSQNLDLGTSPGWWADTVATYCPGRPSELLVNNCYKTLQTSEWKPL